MLAAARRFLPDLFTACLLARNFLSRHRLAREFFPASLLRIQLAALLILRTR